MNKNSKKVLVTGAPGWLGSRFVKFLDKKGRDIRCLVFNKLDASELEEIGVEVFRGDLTDPESLKGVAKNVETVFHLAGIVHTSLFGGGDFFRVNFRGTKNILEQSIKEDAQKFIYISSNSAVGCNFSKDILMHEYTQSSPYMNYGKSKRKAEEVVNNAFHKGEINTTILRPCWYYGPNQPERQTGLMNMIIEGRAPIFGKGDNLRSMTYIDNLCDAMLLAEQKDVSIGETYWIADERPYTTKEIYKTIADLLGVELETMTFPAICSDLSALGDSVLQAFNIYQKELHVAGEMNKNIACSIKKAKKDLGYEPKVGLKEGMKRSIKWAKEKGKLNL